MDLKNHKRPLSRVDFWSWLFPVTYLIHIAEEYWGGEGYPAYILRVRGVHLSTTNFFVAQSLGAVLMALGVILARRFNFAHMMAIIMATIAMVNGLTHAWTSLSHGGYGPGLLSSVLIWIPLGLFVLIHFRNDVGRKRYWTGVSIGLAVNVLVWVITMRGARLV